MTCEIAVHAERRGRATVWVARHRVMTGVVCESSRRVDAMRAVSERVVNCGIVPSQFVVNGKVLQKWHP